LYYAISGDPEKDCHQGFEYVIKDKAFYKENVYKCFPNPQPGIKDKKKPSGVSFEKEEYVMVSVRLNDDVDLMSYKSSFESSVRVMGINRGFMMIELNSLRHTRGKLK
jgi:hypothetical protein